MGKRRKHLRDKPHEKLPAEAQKVAARKRQVKSSASKYGSIDAIPMATGRSWACPMHGRLVLRLNERSLSHGYESSVGPYVRYDIAGMGRPEVLDVVSMVSWAEYWCHGDRDGRGAHPLRVHYEVATQHRLYPGIEPRLYIPEPDEEYYPVVHFLFPHLYEVKK